MIVHLTNNGYALSAKFPMTVFEMQDALDKLKYPTGNRNVTFRIYEFRNMDMPSELWKRNFSADIYKLNLFAERIEKLNNMEMTAFKSLLTADPDSDFDDMLLMTYGLDCVPVWPCSDLAELGEAMIENDMVEELNEIPDELIDLIDREKIGRLCQDREDGIFVDGYYCVPSSYEPPDINIEIGEPERCFFRLLIAPAPINDESTEQFAQWLSLPCEKENLNNIAKDLGIGRVHDMVYYDFQSSLPTICDENFGDMHRIDELNDLAQRLSELSDYDFVKLKAVMENEKICEISDTIECIEHLSEYDFDMLITNEGKFGRTYFAKNMLTNFDNSILDTMDLYDFSEKILERTGGKITSYGAISGRGQELYSSITVQREQTQTEENTEDICEDFLEEDPEEDESEDFEMGGMSM